MMQYRLTTVVVLALASRVLAFDYAYAPYNQGRLDPQPNGWPLTEAERAFVLKAEYERRPGQEDPAAPKHRPDLWPVTPMAGYWGGTSWLDTHAGLVKAAQASRGPIDVLLVGDSLTMQWGAAWTRHFGQSKTVNLGIGGDKTQNVLWRLEHGGAEGLEPRVCVLLIGNNNMFFTPETGIEPAAKGIKVCADWLRSRWPAAPLVVVKIFPAHAPGMRFYEDIKLTNAALDKLKLEDDPQVRVLDLWSEMVNADGQLKAGLFLPDKIHLTQDGGYELYAARLKPYLSAALSGQPLPRQERVPLAAALPPPTRPVPELHIDPPVTPPATATLAPAPVVTYPYAPYNQGRLDPQLTGWPLSAAEAAYVAKPEYSRKPGQEANQHLPALWPTTPSAAVWEAPTGQGNPWLDHHAALIARVARATDGPEIVLLGDSLTQGWGGGWDGSPFNEAWRRALGQWRTVNLGLGGDRTESLLWRLDHGALAGAAPRVAVLMIGVNNAPLVANCGVPAAAVAQGVALCVRNVRARCPGAAVVLVKLLPAFAPGDAAHEAVNAINRAVDALKLADDPRVHVLDLSSEFSRADGSLRAEAYSDGHLHLSAVGYERLAAGLAPAVNRLVGSAAR